MDSKTKPSQNGPRAASHLGPFPSISPPFMYKYISCTRARLPLEHAGLHRTPGSLHRTPLYSEPTLARRRHPPRFVGQLSVQTAAPATPQTASRKRQRADGGRGGVGVGLGLGLLLSQQHKRENGYCCTVLYVVTTTVYSLHPMRYKKSAKSLKNTHPYRKY